ncbi:MAG: response regulator, partial [Nitrospirae bacterium]|nr:response regulator [Nitrospirota bacterium]
MSKIKVFIIDDSAVVRSVLTQLFSEDPEMEVVGQAVDPIFAMEKLRKIRPDVITLDIEMPRMDGITFLRHLMANDPIPVVICSSLSVNGTETAMKALEAGAVEIITKPQMGVKGFLEDARAMIVDAVKGAAKARLHQKAPSLEVRPKLTADAVIGRG